MGLAYTTTRWLDRLWAEHLAMSQPARDLVQAGIGKQGPPFAGFPADIHARLYLPSDPAAIDHAPDWAAHLHHLATELGEWQRLRVMCSRNGFAAGIAAEAMLEQLLPQVPERPPAQSGAQPGTEPDSGPGDAPQTQQDGPGDPRDPQDQSRQGQPSRTPQKGSQDPQNAGPENPSNDSQLRAALRKAVRAARDAVQQAETGLEGVAASLYIHAPGTAVVHQAGPANLKAVRDAHSRLAGSYRLRRIAELAGRLERLAVQKARSKVKPGVGEVHGVGLGGLADLARLLPSELVAFRRRPLRLHLLARLLQARALVYEMQGREPQARGPIVILLDESGSMREAGKDIWSKAVCLALLATATRQRRAWHLVAFNGAIIRDLTIPAGKATAADIQAALDHGCSGGTDFDAPVISAAELIRTSATMKQADVVIITDGEDELEPPSSTSTRRSSSTPASAHLSQSRGRAGTRMRRPRSDSMAQQKNGKRSSRTTEVKPPFHRPHPQAGPGALGPG